MVKRTVVTEAAPKAIGPYSQAVWAGDMLYCSGQLGLNPETGLLAGDDAVSQVRQALKNVRAILESQGLTPENVVKSTVFLIDMNDFKEVNAEYAVFFAQEPPARSCVAVAALPANGRVEVEVIACRK